MRKLLILSWMALALFACNKSSTSSTEATSAATSTEGSNSEGESKPDDMARANVEEAHSTYSGKINGKIEATLDLFRLDEIVRGTITYQSSGKPIMVLGKMEAGGTFFLREFQPDGLVTGIMSFEMKGDGLSGTWFGTSKEQELSLAMTRTEAKSGAEWPYELSKSVVGEYGYHFPEVATGDAGAAGGMTVKQSGDQILFSIDCVNGPPGYHMAMIEETEGTLEGSEIEFSIPDFNCQFMIRFFDGFAVVEPIETTDDCGFGMGATIEGEFVKLR